MTLGIRAFHIGFLGDIGMNGVRAQGLCCFVQAGFAAPGNGYVSARMNQILRNTPGADSAHFHQSQVPLCS